MLQMRPLLSIALCALYAHLFLPSAVEVFAQDKERDEGYAALDQDPSLWVGKLIVQRRGWVLDKDGPDNLIKEGYWELHSDAKGEVVSVSDDGFCTVHFDDKTGWERHELQVKSRTYVKAYYDYYGNVFLEKWTKEGMSVNPDDHGRIVDEQDGITVRFRLLLVGMSNPRVGAKVVRGPDWPKRRFVDGCLDENDGPCIGEVVEPVGKDFYIRVKWEKTGLIEAHRFDCRRRYDVMEYKP